MGMPAIKPTRKTTRKPARTPDHLPTPTSDPAAGKSHLQAPTSDKPAPMPMRATRSVIYTEQPSAADDRLLAAYGLETDEQRRAEIASQIRRLEQWRITVGALSALQFARFQQARATIPAWIEAQTGRKFAQAIDEPAGMQLWAIAIQWAHLIGGFLTLERRTISQMADDDDPAWESIPMPDAWMALETAAAAIPVDLLAIIDSQIDRCNPDLFYTSAGEEGKKKGRITVT